MLKMQCVIAGENLGNVFSCEIYKWYKTGQYLFFESYYLERKGTSITDSEPREKAVLPHLITPLS